MSDEPPFRRTPNPPVERASTVLIARAEDLYGMEPPPYGRFGHTVHRDLCAAFTKLAGGADTTLVSSGLQACTTAILALVKSGDHVLISDNVYGPNRGFCQTALKRLGVDAEFYDPHIGANIASLMRPNTTLVFLESPGSLTLEIQDVPAITAAARAGGALSVIDDTWSGGVFLKPLALGVDVVAHAATKYPSGASDVFLGAIIAREAHVTARIRHYARSTGAHVSPDDAYLVLRGMRTLEMRLAHHQASALALTDWLAARPQIARVIYPARADHPDHAIWRRDFTGASGVFSVEFAPMSRERINAFLNALQVIALGFSFGGFESLAILCDPQLKRDHANWDTAGPLVRFSVGLEPVDELIADLERGLAALGQ